MLAFLPSCDQSIVPLVKRWESPFPCLKVPTPGIPSIMASDCGRCHQSIFEEWRNTTHAKAFSDIQFQAEWEKDKLFLCPNCHAPLLNQQEFLVQGLVGGDYHRPRLKPNQQFDPALREEGITCAVCHVREGAVIGSEGDSADAPHPVKGDPAYIDDLCMRCHNVRDKVSPTLVCSFNTGTEWRKSRFPGLGMSCVTCHMPPVRRPIANGGKIRQTRRHTFPGSGIAKRFADQPAVSEEYIGGLSLEILPLSNTPAPGEAAKFRVKLKNAFAGHELPTGDPERFITVTLQVIGETGEILIQKEETIGESWEWRPKAEKISDNSLKPGEERVISLSCHLPPTPGNVRFRVTLSNHRMTEKNARYMDLWGKYPLEAEITRKEKLISF